MYPLFRAAKWLGVAAWELDDQPIAYMRQALIIEAAERRAEVEQQKIERAKAQAKALARPKSKRRRGLT